MTADDKAPGGESASDARAEEAAPTREEVTPLERHEVALPDGRRVLLYSRRDG